MMKRDLGVRLLLIGLFTALIHSAVIGADGGERLAGSYYRGDHLGYNVTLNLVADGTYSSTWTGCLGVYGTASGHWKIRGDDLVLTPATEAGLMKGHLTVLKIRRSNGHFELLPVEDEPRLKSEEERKMLSFAQVPADQSRGLPSSS